MQRDESEKFKGTQFQPSSQSGPENPNAKLQEDLRFSSLGLIRPRKSKYVVEEHFSYMTNQKHLAKASDVVAPKETFAFDGFSDSDETDSDIDVEDDMLAKKERAYTGKDARDTFFESYHDTSLKRIIRLSDEEVGSVVDQPQTPRRKYIDKCNQETLVPEPLLFRKTDKNKSLNLSHYGIGDARAEALSSSLAALPNLNHLDLSDCRMHSTSVLHIVEAMESRPKEDDLTSLKLSHNMLSMKSMSELAKLLAPSAKCSLIHIQLRNCNISDAGIRILANSLRDNKTCTALDISKNQIGSKGGSYLGGLLKGENVLTDLDLSWNTLRDKGSLDFVRALPQSCLVKINLAMNALGRSGAASLLGRNLPRTSLEVIDLSGNQVDPFSVCILMNGVVEHRRLKSVILSHNVIGKVGIRAVLRTLDACFHDASRPQLLINIDETGSDITDSSTGFSKLGKFNFQEPAGVYDLDMSIPEEYVVACELLRIANSKNGSEIVSVMYKPPTKNGKFKVIKVRRKDYGFRDSLMGRPVSTVRCDTGEAFEIPHDGELKIVLKVLEHMPKFFNAVSQAGFLEVHSILSQPQGSLNRIATLKAACEAFYFTHDQSRSLLNCFDVVDLQSVVPDILTRTAVSEEGDALTEEYRHYLEGQHANFVRVIPTNTYKIDLSIPIERHLVLTLIRISNDENVLAQRDPDYQDLSQNGDKSSFRNVTLDGEPYKISAFFDVEHSLPKEGHLWFDFVSRNIAPLTAVPFEKKIPDEAIETSQTFRFWLRTNYITCEQLKNVMKRLPNPPDYMTLNQKIEGLFHLLDADNGGEVDKLEVLEAILKNPDVGDFMCQIPELEPLLEPRTFGPAFDAIDQDGGGSLDLDEFKQMCGIAVDIAEVAEAMFEADDDGEWDEEEDAELRERLKTLVANKLNLAAKGARERMATGTLSEQLDAVMHMFDECDIGKKEYLMPEEFAELSKNLGVILSPSELDTAVEDIDEDGNGQIEVDEYLDWWGDDDLKDLYDERCNALESGKPYRLLGSSYKGTAEERLASIRDLFNEEDTGNKGYLMPQEFGRLSLHLGIRLTSNELIEAVQTIDEDGNGQIEVDEYLAWWGDDELIHLYEMQCNALEANKPYKMMADDMRGGSIEQRFAVVQHLFERNDGGQKGYLDPMEFGVLSASLGVNLSPYELMKAVEEIDEDGNGQIEIDEYLDWWADPELLQYYNAQDDPESIKLPGEAKAFANKWFEDRERAKLDMAERIKLEEVMRKNGEHLPSNIVPGMKKKKKKQVNRIDYVVAAHCRVVDMHNFFIFWDLLSKSEQLELMHRLGWLNTFDPVSPERRHYLDLTNREERVIVMMLVRLAMVEPGENWLHEHYFNPMFKPGWELPLSWATKVPEEGNLVLTYAAAEKGGCAVWSERIKLRKFTCIPKAAPLPPEADIEHGLHTLGHPITYTAFIRLVSSESEMGITIHNAIASNQELWEKLVENDPEAVHSSPTNTAKPHFMHRQASMRTVEFLREGGGNVANPIQIEPLAEGACWEPFTQGESIFFDLLNKYAHVIHKAKGDELDLEQVLQVEWSRYLDDYEKAKQEDETIINVAKRFDELFESIDW